MLNDCLLEVTFVNVADCLVQRCYDVNAHVRREAVVAIGNIFKSPSVDVSNMPALVNCVKERLRDIQVFSSKDIRNDTENKFLKF